MIIPLGKVVVAIPGTPVPLSPTPLQCNRIICMCLNANAAQVYVGLATMVVATLADCLYDGFDAGQIFEIPPNTALGNGIDAGAICIDGAAGEGVVAYAVR